MEGTVIATQKFDGTMPGEYFLSATEIGVPAKRGMGGEVSRRQLLRLIGSGALSLAAGCTPAARHRAVTIRFWNGWTGPDGGKALLIVRRFNRENPDVEVRMQRIDWGTYYNKLFVAGIAGRAPELFIIHTPSLRRFVDAGFVQSLDEFVARDKFPVADLDANVWEAARLNGAHYGLPVDVHTLGAFWNRRLLKAAGFSDAPATREEFVAALRAIVQTGNRSNAAPDDRVWGFTFSNPSSTVYSLMRQFGGPFFSDDQSRCLLDSPQNAAALAFCQELIQREKTVPPLTGGDPWVSFRQGRVGITWNGIYMLPDLQKQKDLDFAGAPVSNIGGTAAVWASSHNFCIKSGLDARTSEAAWRFARFYSDNSLDWAEAGQIPTRRSLRDSERFRQMPVQSAFARQIPYASYPPQLPFVFEFQTEFDYMVERVLRGSVTPEAALRDATNNIGRIIERRAEERREVKGLM